MNDPEMTLYFAYGSNMDAGQMALRCAGARLVRAATLDGFRFIINARLVATIAPDVSAHVHGLLWMIDEGDEKTLDSYEGVEYGTYRKETVGVVDDAGGASQTLTYIASNNMPCKVVQGDGYLERIVTAARSKALPDDYVLELESWFE